MKKIAREVLGDQEVGHLLERSLGTYVVVYEEAKEAITTKWECYNI